MKKIFFLLGICFIYLYPAQDFSLEVNDNVKLNNVTSRVGNVYFNMLLDATGKIKCKDNNQTYTTLVTDSKNEYNSGDIYFKNVPVKLYPQAKYFIGTLWGNNKLIVGDLNQPGENTNITNFGYNLDETFSFPSNYCVTNKVDNLDLEKNIENYYYLATDPQGVVIKVPVICNGNTTLGPCCGYKFDYQWIYQWGADCKIYKRYIKICRNTDGTFTTDPNDYYDIFSGNCPGGSDPQPPTIYYYDDVFFIGPGSICTTPSNPTIASHIHTAINQVPCNPNGTRSYIVFWTDDQGCHSYTVTGQACSLYP